ncbi:DNA polymerase alpha/epsilon subunit B-domain-containing protein [Aspergillus karnatakaensis]|uniref:DNA polymerase epsilon noncatalytic subunit n=1 Tax=Aspergillus karnatakaensis TaxID=1810916 RepID=UPI003CCDD2CD
MESANPVPSSSPGFGTPAHPVRSNKLNSGPIRASILPILIPPSTLRPVAFRTFTRKHNLTLSSPALQTLAAFVGKNCGSGWREEGLAERVLDEVAKTWRKAGGGVIVEEGKGASLKSILQTLEGNMSSGRVIDPKLASKDVSLRTSSADKIPGLQPSSLTIPRLDDQEQDASDDTRVHPRHWLKVIEAFDTPRLTYNADKKHFEATRVKPSLFPQPSHKTTLFRDRYNIVHQRLLRNESFQVSLTSVSVSSLQRSSSSFARTQCYKLTPVANLLGRSGTSHLLLGLLSTSTTGELSLTDLTGSIVLDLSHARLIPEDGAWLTPGMFVLVDGIYEEEENVRGSTLGGNTGVGGAIGGKLVGISICGPPCERRDTSLGMNIHEQSQDISSSGGFGWVDFLGVGSERAQGARMRQVQTRCLRESHDGIDSTRHLKAVFIGEVNLDNVKTFDALRKVLNLYSEVASKDRPDVFALFGNFVQKAIINGGGQGGSIEYKECFDMLALTLSDFPSLLQRSTFIFVPGDNDPWSSAFSEGASSAIPRHAVPDLFTSRIKRAFATANSQLDRNQNSEPPGEAVWTTNPSRMSLFGPVHDIAILRDNISGRLRRNAINVGLDPTELDDGSSSAAGNEGQIPTEGQQRGKIFNQATPDMRLARKLVKTILDQGSMSPFSQPMRPVLWDYASSLQLYPLPTAFVVADPETAPFCVTYENCHVMNPGRFLPENDSSSMTWIEYDILKNRGRVKKDRF